MHAEIYQFNEYFLKNTLILLSNGALVFLIKILELKTCFKFVKKYI